MNPRAQATLRAKFDEMSDRLSPAGEISYEDGMATIGPYVRNQDAFLLALLTGTSQTVFPPEVGFVAAEFSSDNLEKIDTKEKLWSIIASLPDDAVPDLQRLFNHILKKGLPAVREALQEKAKQLPRPPGGRPPKWPSQEICRRICDKISALHLGGTTMLAAQQRAADEWNLKLRMIQRIWSKRELNT